MNNLYERYILHNMGHSERAEIIGYQARVADLKRQSDVYIKSNHNGHNRHSGLTSLEVLGHRRRRRRWRMLLSKSVEIWNLDHSGKLIN